MSTRGHTKRKRGSSRHYEQSGSEDQNLVEGFVITGKWTRGTTTRKRESYISQQARGGSRHPTQSLGGEETGHCLKIRHKSRRGMLRGFNRACSIEGGGPKTTEGPEMKKRVAVPHGISVVGTLILSVGRLRPTPINRCKGSRKKGLGCRSVVQLSSRFKCILLNGGNGVPPKQQFAGKVDGSSKPVGSLRWGIECNASG